MSRSLADLTSVEVGTRARSGAVLVVPLGSTEQHGPHLPLTTDTDIAVAVCERLARARADVLVAPAVPYGSSGEHAGFAGTLSIGQQAIETLVLELGRSACETFDRVLFVSAHGGNAEPVTRAVTRLRAESRDVSVWFARVPKARRGDAHAGHAETSMQLALRPERVRAERAVVGDLRPMAELMPALREGGVRAVTSTGVLGDPTTATAEDGERLLAELTASLLEHLAGFGGQPRYCGSDRRNRVGEAG